MKRHIPEFTLAQKQRMREKYGKKKLNQWPDFPERSEDYLAWVKAVLEISRGSAARTAGE